MPNPKGTLKERLARYRQIKISVIGRKSGKAISTAAPDEITAVNAIRPLLFKRYTG